MPNTHIIKEIHQKELCAYCHNDLRNVKWNSEFHGHIHYKTSICPKCSSDQRIKVEFDGTGHDKWDGVIPSIIFNEKEKLEDTVKKEEKIKK